MGVSRVRGNASKNFQLATEERNFGRMKNVAERMRLERSGLLPETVERYVALKKWYKESMDDHRKAKIEQNKVDLQLAKEQNREIARVYGGKTMAHTNSGILGLHTVWAREWKATEDHPQAPWPTIRELKEEGDERFTSNYGRYLPIPRLPGNSTVVYKQRSWTPVDYLDQVMPVPKNCGMVNPNMYGFTDIEVDEFGVPYDDPDLPGPEYIIEEKVSESSSTRKRSDLRCRALSGLTDFGSGSPGSKARSLDVYTVSSIQSPDTLNAEAAEFVPRNIPAPKIGTIQKWSDLPVVEGDKELELRGDFLESVPTLVDNTPESLKKVKHESIGVTNPWKVNNALRGNLRINTNVDQFRGDDLSMYDIQAGASSAQTSTVGDQNFDTMLAMSPDAAFRLLNPYHDLGDFGNRLRAISDAYNRSPNADTPSKSEVFGATGPEGLGKGILSPLKLPVTTAFSAKYRANRPATLKLTGGHSKKPKVKTVSDTPVESDLGDEEELDEEDDGGVIL